MLSKTKIYIDKDSLEIIAQDSTISDYYYKNIIEIFRRHADLYLDLTETELTDIQEPKDLNNPGDIYSFIEGKNLPWPSAANETFNAIKTNGMSPDINGNIIYILKNKNDVAKLRDCYGVWAVCIDDVNDDVFYYEFKPDLNVDTVPGMKDNGWNNILKDEIKSIPPSNSMVISDSNLLTNNIKKKGTDENHFCGLVNLTALLDLILPQKMSVPYYISIICPPTNKLEDGKMKKIITRWIDEIKVKRKYTIIIEFLLSRKTLHSRDLYANNYRIHFDRGFYVFEPWTNRVHKDDVSHNDVRVYSYLCSPFQRGKDNIMDAIDELKLLLSKYNAFLRNTGEVTLVNSKIQPVTASDYSKNRILF